MSDDRRLIAPCNDTASTGGVISVAIKAIVAVRISDSVGSVMFSIGMFSVPVNAGVAGAGVSSAGSPGGSSGCRYGVVREAPQAPQPQHSLPAAQERRKCIGT